MYIQKPLPSWWYLNFAKYMYWERAREISLFFILRNLIKYPCQKCNKQRFTSHRHLPPLNLLSKLVKLLYWLYTDCSWRRNKSVLLYTLQNGLGIRNISNVLKHISFLETTERYPTLFITMFHLVQSPSSHILACPLVIKFPATNLNFTNQSWNP